MPGTVRAPKRPLEVAGALALLVLLAPLSAAPLRAAGPQGAPSDSKAAGADAGRWAKLGAERLPLAVCRPDGAKEDLLCGSFPVPEDRTKPDGRQIALRVVVVPARTERPEPDPIVPVGGGPGEAITEAAPGVAQEFGDLLARRDVLLVDQRGTGGSNGLYCSFGITTADPQPAYDTMFPLDGVKACRAELEKKADLTRYTTTIAVEDLEAVRRWLGYGKLDLIGGSYGTRFVQEFLRRHPDSARTAVLQGVVTMDQRMPLQHARDGQRSLDMVLALCGADPACHKAFPNVRNELWEVLDRLETTPGTATVDNPIADGKVSLSVGRGIFAEALRSKLYTAHGSAEVPFLIHRAYAGDFAPFFKATIPWRVFVELRLANGMYLSDTCAEDTRWFTQEEAHLDDMGSALGDFRVSVQKAACAVWPTAEIPADFRQPVATDVPVLMLDGELDPVTPPRYGRDAASHMPNSLLVVVPGGHHGLDLSHQECVLGLTKTFLETGTVQGLDTSCVATMERPPFVTEESGMGYMKKDEGEGG